MKSSVGRNPEARANLPTIRVRQAVCEDQPAIKALVLGVLAEFGITVCASDPQDQDLDDLTGWYPPPRGVFEVLEDDAGRILGCGGVRPLSDACCELRKMYFLPELRGKGVGSAFLHRLVSFAKEAGFKRMELETASVLQAAIALYQRRGFRVIPKRHALERCDRAFELELSHYRAPRKIRSLTAKDGDVA